MNSIRFCDNCGATIRFDAKFCYACGQPQLTYPNTATGLLVASQQLKGRYRIIEKLGQGGFGAIYKVEDMLFNGAIKAVKERGIRGLNPQEQSNIAVFKEWKLLLPVLPCSSGIPSKDMFVVPIKEANIMTNIIETKVIQPQAAMSIRVITTPTEIGQTLGQILGEVWTYLQGRGVQPAGPPFARYYEYRADHVDMEAGLPVSSPVAGAGRISADELPGGKVAVTWHIGPYDTLHKTYVALESWVQEQNQEAAGAPWEVYWTDPGEEPDSSAWRTEVICPLI
jgi:effector-binding domain-containing protein